MQYSRPSSITDKYEDVVDTHIMMKDIVNSHKNKMDWQEEEWAIDKVKKSSNVHHERYQ